MDNIDDVDNIDHVFRIDKQGWPIRKTIIVKWFWIGSKA